MSSSSSHLSDSQQALFVQLLTSSHGKLLGYLMSLLGRQHDAEDVLQKASVTMWEKFDSFQEGTDFVAWASTIAFYTARNFQRLASRSPLQFNDALLDTLSAERLDDLPQIDQRTGALEHCITRLNESDRQLVVAAYMDGAAIGELAARVNRAPQTLYNKLNFIRRALADCVQNRLREEST